MPMKAQEAPSRMTASAVLAVVVGMVSRSACCPAPTIVEVMGCTCQLRHSNTVCALYGSCQV